MLSDNEATREPATNDVLYRLRHMRSRFADGDQNDAL
jgi:hypothetical protein